MPSPWYENDLPAALEDEGSACTNDKGPEWLHAIKLHLLLANMICMYHLEYENDLAAVLEDELSLCPIPFIFGHSGSM